MKRMLITGASGFIGSNVMKYFALRGYKIYGWDLTRGMIEQQEIESVNLLDAELIKNKLNEIKPDVIIHCAGCADVGKSVSDPFMDFDGNTKVVHNLLFAMKDSGLQNTRFVFLSSAAVYGNPKSLPIKEDVDLNPLSPYALHKELAENICRYFMDNYKFDVKIIRIFSAYGDGLKKQIFWDMSQKIKLTASLPMFGTGRESRDYIHIQDILNAMHLIIETAPICEIVYNVANGEETTIKEVAETLARVENIELEKVNFCGEVREGEPINWVADISKLQRLGYKKSVTLEQGIKRYAEWVKTV